MLIFSGNFTKKFRFFQAISRKMSIFSRNFTKNLYFTGKNWPSTATIGQIIWFLFKSHHFQTYFLYILSFNNISRPIHNPLPKIWGVANPQSPRIYAPVTHTQTILPLMAGSDPMVGNPDFLPLPNRAGLPMLLPIAESTLSCSANCDLWDNSSMSFSASRVAWNSLLSNQWRTKSNVSFLAFPKDPISGTSETIAVSTSTDYKNKVVIRRIK